MSAAKIKLAVAIVSVAIWAGPATAFPVQAGSGYQGIIVPHAPPGQDGFAMHGNGDEHSSIGANGLGPSDFGNWGPESVGDEEPSYFGPHYPGPGSREFFLAYAHHKYCCNAANDSPLPPGAGTAAVPEPATLALLSLALIGLGYTRRRCRA